MSSRTDEDRTEPTDIMLNSQNEKKVEDKYYMTYVLFYAMGTLTLVPANFFTTATDYWMYKFRNVSDSNYNSENRTGLQAQFISDYSIVSNVTNVAFLVITFFLAKKITLLQRIFGSLGGIIIMFTLTVIFVQVNTDTWQIGFFAFTLVTGALLTAFCAVFMVSLFETVSKFPAGYLAAMLSGQSICGMFSALVQIFSLSIGASSLTSGLVYFLVGMFFVFMSLVYLIVIVNKSEFFKVNMMKKTDVEKPKITKELLLSILDKIKFYLISMIIVLGCSIMIHPAVTSLVVSVDKGNGNKWNDVFFVPVSTFLFYNLFDYIGREMSGKIKWPSNSIIIMIASICRISFVPMLMFCNAQPRHHLPVAFNADYAYIILIIIFAFTNGYLVNLCVIQIPSVTSESEKKVAVILIVVFMIVSMGSCAFISAALVNAL